LINAQGRYCDIPDISECVKCLACNKRSYVPIYADQGIQAWRSSWALLLNACDEIRLFSEDSARLFLKVYGGLDLKTKMVIVPHQVSIAKDRLKEQVPPAPLRIGVVGNINFEKGSAVVKRLAEYIDQRDLPIRLVLFGSMDVSVDCKCFHDAGPYAVDGLAQLLRSNHINVCLLPSVCPETFSYACQELMELGVPVACFDLGAPPERVRHYAYGRVLASAPQASAEMILQELISFHHSVYAS
jgi:glycosyltransferase involved in cell wall biosynthesis